MKFLNRITVFLCVCLSFFMGSPALATSPWFTGPLLAGSGKTIPAGHTNYEAYLFYTDNFGHYNNKWKKRSTIKTTTLSPTLLVTQGLSSRFDLGASAPFDAKWKGGQSDSRFSDVGVSLGYQLLRHKTGTWIPDVRLIVSETLPTGHYQNLNPGKNGTDAAGAGAYQTSFGVNLQRVWVVSNGHFLRGRLSTKYTVPSSVHLHSFNAFGGGFNTDGTIRLGDHFSTDLAFEYTLTRHWVPALDILYTNSASNSFTGTMGVTSTGLPAVISSSSSSEISVAPAVEYNFTSHFGIIAGGWFALEGRNSSDFNAAVLALNYYD